MAEYEAIVKVIPEVDTKAIDKKLDGKTVILKTDADVSKAEQKYTQLVNKLEAALSKAMSLDDKNQITAQIKHISDAISKLQIGVGIRLNDGEYAKLQGFLKTLEPPVITPKIDINSVIKDIKKTQNEIKNISKDIKPESFFENLKPIEAAEGHKSDVEIYQRKIELQTKLIDLRKQYLSAGGEGLSDTAFAELERLPSTLKNTIAQMEESYSLFKGDNKYNKIPFEIDIKDIKAEAKKAIDVFKNSIRHEPPVEIPKPEFESNKPLVNKSDNEAIKEQIDLVKLLSEAYDEYLSKHLSDNRKADTKQFKRDTSLLSKDEIIQGVLSDETFNANRGFQGLLDRLREIKLEADISALAVKKVGEKDLTQNATFIQIEEAYKRIDELKKSIIGVSDKGYEDALLNNLEINKQIIAEFTKIKDLKAQLGDKLPEGDLGVRLKGLSGETSVHEYDLNSQATQLKEIVKQREEAAAQAELEAKAAHKAAEEAERQKKAKADTPPPSQPESSKETPTQVDVSGEIKQFEELKQALIEKDKAMREAITSEQEKFKVSQELEAQLRKEADAEREAGKASREAEKNKFSGVKSGSTTKALLNNEIFANYKNIVLEPLKIKLDIEKLDNSDVEQRTKLFGDLAVAQNKAKTIAKESNLTEEQKVDILRSQATLEQEIVQIKRSTLNQDSVNSLVKSAKEIYGGKSIANDDQFDIATQKLEALKETMESLSKMGLNAKQMEQAQVSFDKAKFSVDKYNEDVKNAGRTLDDLGLKLEKLKKDNSKALLDPNFSKQITDLEGNISSLTDNIEPGPVKDLVSEFNKLNLSIKASDSSGQSFSQGIENTFKRLGQYVISNVIMTGIRTQISNVISSIDDLDRAMTNLQVVTGWTNAQAKESIMLYNQFARELGVTTQAVMEGADSWLRQGKSVEETNQLIRTSTMFARIAQIDTTEATELLTAALNGYSLQAADAIKITDMFNAVDLVAATSAKELGKAYQYVAASAADAGISQEKLTALLAVGSEKTRLGAETIGTMWKTLISRMQNVKAGKFIDDETGEDLNQVLQVLKKVEIEVINSNGIWRDFGDVFDEIGSKWSTFDQTQQNALATSIAGARQANIFRATMESYGDVLSYTQVAQDSAGTTMEKFGVITDSIDYKVNNFKESLVGIWQNVIGSDIAKGIVDIGNAVTTVFGATDGLLTKIVGYPAAIVAALGVLKTIKGTELFGNIENAFKSLGGCKIPHSIRMLPYVS